ncbi:hypothetical protein [Kitasatospora sp. GP82]|uniref:hypothetical protein n=1 Tax=Kitasatospora sp. GP82 TaxID=3035089 RepID=UPI0024753961|nr:hypothetical protein [Kitasatospora sp. GP82]MDH6125465.1 hypothetical protein [Kitasatospora sp. GP82]
MTETRGTGPVWSDEPLVTGASQPDWTALAERHEQEIRRRKQKRVVATGVVATAAIGGIIATVIQVSGSGHKSASTTAAAVTGSGSRSSAPADSGESALPFADASASVGVGVGVGVGAGASAGASRSAAPTRSATARPAAPAGAGTPAAAPPPAPGPGATSNPPQPAPPAGKPYSARQVCGSGYNVIGSHSLGGASVYLLYNSATGDNCVTTIADNPSGAVPMNSTLTVRGGGSASDPGTFTYYAGPVTEHAPNTCVEWGGSYQGTTWTSSWSHCG